jgi:hypothetical protein
MMLGRYISGTLLILGGAMLLAPEAEQGATGPAQGSAALVGAEVDGAQIDGPVMATRAAAADYGDSDVAAMRRMPVAAPTPVSVETRAGATPRPALGESPRPALEDLVTQARAEGSAPSLEDPGGMAGLVSEQTLALIAAAEAKAPRRETAQAPAAPGAEMLRVTGSRVNLRAGPSTANAVVGSVARGDIVELVGHANDAWAEIRVDGREAFMARRFLDPVASGG